MLSGLGDRLKLLESYSGTYAQNLFEQLTQDSLPDQLNGLETLWGYESINDQRWIQALYSAPWVQRGTLKDIDPESQL